MQFPINATNRLQSPKLAEIAAGIVCAYVSNNPVRVEGLSHLIGEVHATMVRLATVVTDPQPDQGIAVRERPTRAQIRKSVTQDGIVSFIDDEIYKTLKRHLRKHGLDPHSYRQKFGLPDDYPMVAPSYATQRSELAKSMGFGRVGSRMKTAKASPLRAQAGA